MSLRLLAASVLIPAVIGAQVRTIDQGSFTVSVNNQRVGREDFTIIEDASAGTVSYLARATVEYRERGLRLQPYLTANASGVTTTYELGVRGGSIQKWSGTIDRNRVSAYVSTDRGQAAKEFVVSVGALVLDDDVFHQYYFLAKRANEGSVAVIIPQRNTQARVTIARQGTERIELGMREVEAQKLVVTEGSGGTREVWVDAQGRVLKVAIPSRGVVATRDELPPS
ncbi:MAG TPA: hypothetical protein VJ717_00170 [Gemmatimonadaceae bacterium]|nr:hypothetical protein [Gemmatimonadaceae bacterium]